MTIERIKTEVEFSRVNNFDFFEYDGDIYMKMPRLRCTVKEYLSPHRTKEAYHGFNAIRIETPAIYANYEEFEDSAKVKPLKAELRIHE